MLRSLTGPSRSLSSELSRRNSIKQFQVIHSLAQGQCIAPRNAWLASSQIESYSRWLSIFSACVILICLRGDITANHSMIDNAPAVKIALRNTSGTQGNGNQNLLDFRCECVFVTNMFRWCTCDGVTGGDCSIANTGFESSKYCLHVFHLVFTEFLQFRRCGWQTQSAIQWWRCRACAQVIHKLDRK